MIHFFTKFCSIFFSALYLFTSTIGAAEAPLLWDLFNPLTKNNCDTCTPPCICHWFVRGDFLFWRAFEHGLECNCIAATITDTILADESLSTTIREKNPELNFEWSAGFRAGIGCNFNNGTSAEIYYTHYFTRGFANRQNRPRDRAHLKIDFNTFDSIVGHDFWYGNCFSYSPFAGIRAAWIKQTLHARLVGELITAAGTKTNLGRFHNRQEFWGVGPEIGVQVDLPLPYGFGLFASGDVALLYGRYILHFNDTTLVDSTTSSTVDSDHFTTSQPAIDLSAGIRFQQEFFYQTFVTLQLAWEHHRYIDYNRIGSGDLCLDGVTLAATWQF